MEWTVDSYGSGKSSSNTALAHGSTAGFRESATQLWRYDSFPFIKFAAVVHACRGHEASFVLTVGFYCGNGIPHQIQAILMNTFNLNMTIRNSIQFGAKSVRCTFPSAICDAPLRASIPQLKGPKFTLAVTVVSNVDCTEISLLPFPGKYAMIPHFVYRGTLNITLALVRTYPWPKTMASTFPLDSIHLVCLSVMNKLLARIAINYVDRMQKPLVGAFLLLARAHTEIFSGCVGMLMT